MHVMGIDPSLSGTGVIALNDEAVIVEQVVLSSKPLGDKVDQRMARLRGLLTPLMEILRRLKPEIVCIEGYSLGSNMPGVSDRVEYGGLMRWMLIERSYVVHEVGPLTLKKWATGKGAGDKTAVIASLTKAYGHVFRSDNEYDAFALAMIAHQIHWPEHPGTAIQQQCIDTVLNGSAKKQKKVAAKS